MKHKRLSFSLKLSHRRALKNISEALEQMTNYSEIYKWRLMSSWIIMQLCEDSLTFNNFRSWYFIQTASKTKWRSKQNTYHVVNKNIAPIKLPMNKDERGDAFRGIPKLRLLFVPEYYLGVPWASPSLGSFHFLFHRPSNLYPKLENFTTQNLHRKSHELR